ncbi:hypothetical protein KR018_003635, partial [Drosophila ironensis]
SDKLTQSKKSPIKDAKTTNKTSTPIKAAAAAAAATIAAKHAAATAVASSCNINNNTSNANGNTKITSKGGSNSVTQTVTQTVTRIGSIGRTTIACITPANNGNNNAASNCNVDAASAAALAAAGVELDSIDEAMTEVIVKIENPDNMSLNGDDGGEAVCNEAIDDENTFDYDLKLNSPLSWTYDAVKIENEDFEDSYLMDNDDDDDDLLTTAAASQKHAKQSGNKLQAAAAGSVAGCQAGSLPVKKIVLSPQQQQQLLEQQQHLQHLNLQPTSQSLQIKLPTIPATITTISAPKQMPGGGGGAGTSGANSSLLASKLSPMDTQNINMHWAHSDDNRYRILVQNKRTRKESLEHSADMIYNADIEKPWVCRNCNRTYKWKNSLKCHLKNECGLPPRYFCSKMCGYATNVHSNLKRHLNTKCRDREKEAEEERKMPMTPGSGSTLAGGNNSGATPSTPTSNNNNNSSNANNNSSSSSGSSTYTLVFQKD